MLAFVGLITLTNGLGDMQWDAYLYCPNGDRVKAPYHFQNQVGLGSAGAIAAGASSSGFQPNQGKNTEF